MTDTFPTLEVAAFLGLAIFVYRAWLLGHQLLVFGRNVAKIQPRQVPPLRRAIGVIFQDFKLLPHRTVAENVAFPLEVRGLPPRDVSRKVAATLRSVGLELKAGKFPLSLSGGEQQRVAVARALASQPKVVLADEPPANLDQATGRALVAMMRELNRERGTTFVFSTHDPMVLEQADRVVRLVDGKIVSDERKKKS